MTTIANAGSRTLNLDAWRFEDYESLDPKQWGGERPFADGKFETPNGKAQFVATDYSAMKRNGLTLNTGRIRDQWHTMTRTGLVPRLFGHRGEPHVEISTVDKVRLNIATASLVEVHNAQGRSLARALISDAILPGTAFQPIHWSSIFANNAVSNVTASEARDPVSDQAAFKANQVSLRPYPAAWYGFGVASDAISTKIDYFAMQPLAEGLAFECADADLPRDWTQFIQELLPSVEIESSVTGSHAAQFRCLGLNDGRLDFAFIASDQPVEVARDWLKNQLGKTINPLEILAGRPMQA